MGRCSVGRFNYSHLLFGALISTRLYLEWSKQFLLPTEFPHRKLSFCKSTFPYDADTFTTKRQLAVVPHESRCMIISNSTKLTKQNFAYDTQVGRYLCSRAAFLHFKRRISLLKVPFHFIHSSHQQGEPHLLSFQSQTSKLRSNLQHATELRRRSRSSSMPAKLRLHHQLSPAAQ
jgi:hypothetical protein